MRIPEASNCRHINDAEFATDHDRLKPPLSRDWFKALGVTLTHTLNPIEGSMINNITPPFQSNFE